MNYIRGHRNLDVSWEHADVRPTVPKACHTCILQAETELVNRLSAFPMFFALPWRRYRLPLRRNDGEWYVMGTMCTRAFIVMGTVCTWHILWWAQCAHVHILWLAQCAHVYVLWWAQCVHVYVLWWAQCAHVYVLWWAQCAHVYVLWWAQCTHVHELVILWKFNYTFSARTCNTLRFEKINKEQEERNISTGVMYFPLEFFNLFSLPAEKNAAIFWTANLQLDKCG